MRQLSLADAMFVVTEQPHRNSNHIGMVFIFDQTTAPEPVTFERFLELYRQRLPLARAFREKMVRVPLDLDFPYWVNDKDFDLEFHVRHSGLPRPGTRKQFFSVVNRLMSLQLDMSRPLWETHFIEGLDSVEGVPPGSFALLCKMHHAAVDGISGMEMITALLESDEAAAARMPSKEWQGEATPDQRKLLVKALGASFSGPIKLTGALLRAFPSIADKRKRQKSGELIKPPKAKAPKTRFNAAVTPHKVLEGRSYPFAEIKRLKNAIPGTTVNDLVLTIVAGSMRRYLDAHKELPTESLIASVPISLRTEGEKGTGGNRLTMAFVKLHTDLDDPLERLAAIGASMREIKDYNKAVDAGSLAQTTEAMPGALFGLAMRTVPRIPASDAVRVSNTVVTNVPGPLSPMTLLGARFVAGFGSGPSQNGVGLFHIITSMSGVLSVGFNADRELMPDPEFYAGCIDESYNELRQAIEARSSTADPSEQPEDPATTKPREKAQDGESTVEPARRKAKPADGKAQPAAAKARSPGKPRTAKSG